MKTKLIEGRKVTQNPTQKRLWDVWEQREGRLTGRVIYTGTLAEIRQALKVKSA